MLTQSPEPFLEGAFRLLRGGDIPPDQHPSMKFILPLAPLLLALSLASAQEIKLLASDGAAGDEFGTSVAVSGTTAIVGSVYDDDSGGPVGSAYVFDTSTGTEVAKLLASDGAAADAFGYSVAISGTTAIVGAPQDDDNGANSGSVYLFDTTTGAQTAKLLASDGAANDLFGISVAISGTTAIVGAVYDDDSGSQSGSAYLFDTTTGAQVAKLLASDGAAFADFGISVAISGTTAIVGAQGYYESGARLGAAYIFDTTTGTEVAKLLASDGRDTDAFGTSVAISGTTAIIGAPYDDDNGANSGSAYLFDTTTGAQIAKLLASDAAATDFFGIAVAISDTTAIVGADWDDDNGSQSGSAYHFDTTTGTQIVKWIASDGAAEDEFGGSVGISGTTCIVGASQHDDSGSQSGAAYLLEVCSGSSTNICVGAVNSRGLGAEMWAQGSTSVAANDLALAAIWCPYNQFGIFYYGAAQAHVTFGNGYRCVAPGGAGLFRFSPVSTGILGVGTWSLDNTNPPQAAGQITADSTWYFQFWYRDPVAGGAYFNLSDALEITFCP